MKAAGYVKVQRGSSAATIHTVFGSCIHASGHPPKTIAVQVTRWGSWPLRASDRHQSHRSVRTAFDIRRYVMKPIPEPDRRHRPRWFELLRVLDRDQKTEIRYLNVASLEFDLDSIVACEIFDGLVE